VTAEAAVNKTGGTSDSTTDIEGVIVCRQFQLTNKILGCLSSTKMKFIKRRQFIPTDCGRCFTDSLYTFNNSFEQLTVCVVFGNAVFSF